MVRIVLDQQRHSATDKRGKNAEDEIGLAPPQRRDEKRSERRHQQRADADATDRDARGKTAAPDEPALHRAHGRNVRKADAQPDAKPVRRIDLRQAAGDARDHEPQSGQDHADDGKTPCAPVVGQRAADDPKAEIKESGQREHDRDRSARGGKILLQRNDKGAETIGAAKADKGDGKGAGNDEPPIKDAWFGRRRARDHNSSQDGLAPCRRLRRDASANMVVAGVEGFNVTEQTAAREATRFLRRNEAMRNYGRMMKVTAYAAGRR